MRKRPGRASEGRHSEGQLDRQADRGESRKEGKEGREGPREGPTEVLGRGARQRDSGRGTQRGGEQTQTARKESQGGSGETRVKAGETEGGARSRGVSWALAPSTGQPIQAAGGEDGLPPASWGPRLPGATQALFPPHWPGDFVASQREGGGGWERRGGRRLQLPGPRPPWPVSDALSPWGATGFPEGQTSDSPSSRPNTRACGHQCAAHSHVPRAQARSCPPARGLSRRERETLEAQLVRLS